MQALAHAKLTDLMVHQRQRLESHRAILVELCVLLDFAVSVTLANGLERLQQGRNNLGCDELCVDRVLRRKIDLLHVKVAGAHLIVSLLLDDLLVQLVAFLLQLQDVVVELVLVHAQAILHLSQLANLLLVVLQLHQNGLLFLEVVTLFQCGFVFVLCRRNFLMHITNIATRSLILLLLQVDLIFERGFLCFSTMHRVRAQVSLETRNLHLAVGDTSP